MPRAQCLPLAGSLPPPHVLAPGRAAPGHPLS